MYLCSLQQQDKFYTDLLQHSCRKSITKPPFSVSCNINSEMLTIIQSNGAEFVFQLFFAPANLLSDEHLKCAVVHHFQLIYINCAKDYNNPDPTPKHTRNLRLFPNPGLYILRTCLCKCFLSPAPHLPECERVC